MVPETLTIIRIGPITTGIIITSTTTTTTITIPVETTITTPTITKLVGITIPTIVVEVTREIEDKIDNNEKVE